MLKLVPVKFRKHRKPIKPSAKQAPVALTLVNAAFVPGGHIDLTFDRAIDISAIEPAAIQVNDDYLTYALYGGGSASLLSAAVVRVQLSQVGDSSGGEIVLNASADNGIVASDDAGAWPGVSDWVLHYP